jgi:thioredoxin-like negative regulator of GroEL
VFGFLSLANDFNLSKSKYLSRLCEQETSGPMVIDFFATWCGPCVLLAPQLEEVANYYKGKVRFLKIDSDENDSISSAMKVNNFYDPG